MASDDPLTRFDAADVRHYYDRHTRRFLRYGQGGGAGVMHRAVWGPDVTTREQAFHFVDDLIAERAHALAGGPSAPLHLVDLGCGVGATLVHLAAALPAMRGTGVTLSPVQARIANDRIRAAGFADRVRCIEGDYTTLPPDLAPVDLACAIESFVHTPSPDQFFTECARVIRPGGLLVIVDDFRVRIPNPGSRIPDPAIERFCHGWRISTLLDGDELQAVAEGAGFAIEWTKDLTPMLEIGRGRDRAIAWFASVLSGLGLADGRFGYLVGGSALQLCLSRGWIGYDVTVFRRT